MPGFARCQALNLTPDFVVTCHDGSAVPGSTYNPSAVGEVGYMAEADAEAAAIAGSVAVSVLNTPAQIQAKVGSAATGQPFTADAVIDGAGGLLRILEGPSDQDYDFTVSISLDGTPQSDVVQTVPAGSTQYQAATLIAANIPTGITLTADANSVRFAPDGGEGVTAFSVTIVPTTP